MIRRDGRRPERIREVILWAQNDSFWRKNILSTGSLRDKFDQVRTEDARKINPRLRSNDSVSGFNRKGERMNYLEAETFLIGGLIARPENFEKIRGRVSSCDFLRKFSLRLLGYLKRSILLKGCLLIGAL